MGNIREVKRKSQSSRFREVDLIVCPVEKLIPVEMRGGAEGRGFAVSAFAE